jgi:DNA modification methylase
MRLRCVSRSTGNYGPLFNLEPESVGWIGQGRNVPIPKSGYQGRSTTMEDFHLIIGDCRHNIKTVEKVDYIFTGPPDFDEVGLDPKSSSDCSEYWGLLRRACDAMINVSPVITIAITDRKCDGKIISKHTFLIHHFISKGWTFLSHKIWIKTVKRNLYRLTYTHIMSFSNEKKVKQSHPDAYEYDVFSKKEEGWRGYEYGINLEVVEPFIWNFTDEGDTVLDPFLGSGTTAVACLQNNRKCIGIELTEKAAVTAKSRVAEQGGLERARKLFE